MIYLDYQATTPLAPEAREAMLPFLGDAFGNPHSPHRMGREARAVVELARERIAALLPSGGRIAFTSGATEALNWAIKGVAAPGRVTIATEHAAVLDTVQAHCGDIAILAVDNAGLADPAAIAQPGAGLAAAMLVNNEIGVIQPVAALADRAHAVGALFLCDAVQGYGRVAIPEECDLIAISAHKIHGPKGIGALWVRDGIDLAPLMHGGAQEALGRSGTLSPMLCAGFGVAAQLMADRAVEDHAHIERLWHAARAAFADWTLNGSAEHRYHGNLNLRRDGVDAARLISDVRTVAFSAGSACASGSGRPSHVLKAIGLTDREARSSIRRGFGRYTTPAEIEEAAALIEAAAARQLRYAA